MIINVLTAHEFLCPQPLNPPGPIACSGRRCMAWRWSDQRRVYGFCGLAGEPLNTGIEEIKEKD